MAHATAGISVRWEDLYSLKPRESFTSEFTCLILASLFHSDAEYGGSQAEPPLLCFSLQWQLEGERTDKSVFRDEPQLLPEHMKESSQYAFLLRFNQTPDTLVLLIVIHVQSSLQVGIILHYSTLATVLWVGVTARNIYKQVTKKAKRCQDPDEPPAPPRPMLRYPEPLFYFIKYWVCFS